MMIGDERRKHIRVFFPEGKVRLLSGQILSILGRTVDISLGGLRFTCEMVMAIGETLNLEIVLADGMRFKCSARVVHFENENGRNICGACFLVDEHVKSELGKLIMQLKVEQDRVVKDRII